MVLVGGCSLLSLPTPTVRLVLCDVGPDPASIKFAVRPVVSHGPANAVPALKTTTEQPKGVLIALRGLQAKGRLASGNPLAMAGDWRAPRCGFSPGIEALGAWAGKRVAQSETYSGSVHQRLTSSIRIGPAACGRKPSGQSGSRGERLIGAPRPTHGRGLACHAIIHV